MNKMYVCPRTGKRYIPSKLQKADLDPSILWARCTRCDARGRRRGKDADYNPEQGQWHGVPKVSLLGLRAALVRLNQARRIAERVQAARAAEQELAEVVRPEPELLEMMA